jgi:ATP-binding cassette subfamily C protein CydC
VLLAVLAFGVLSSFEAVQNLGTAFQHLEASEESATRLFQIIDQPPPVLAPAKSRTLPKSNEIVFEDVHFAYASRNVLQEVRFTLPTGGKLAVVGASGGGKSTLIHLLVRFQDVARGRITLGGTDVRDLDPEALRTRFAVVAQDAHLFNTTVRNNLMLAHPDASEPEMFAALEQAGLLDLLAELPDGLDTWCEQDGSRFSGGERRRLALAQALLKPSPILILDEPLANLDGVQEQRLLDTLATVGRQRSLLMVTHRLIRMEFWDQILVLQQGQIVERGTHRELMRVQGPYRRMVRTQSGQLPSR